MRKKPTQQIQADKLTLKFSGGISAVDLDGWEIQNKQIRSVVYSTIHYGVYVLYKSSWWFQPIWKNMFVKFHHFPE